MQYDATRYGDNCLQLLVPFISFAQCLLYSITIIIIIITIYFAHKNIHLRTLCHDDDDDYDDDDDEAGLVYQTLSKLTSKPRRHTAEMYASAAKSAFGFP